MSAAQRLGAEVQVVIASEQPNTLQKRRPDNLLTLDFLHPEEAARAAREFARTRPISAVVGVDDDTAVVAAYIAEALSLPHNSVASALAARNKYLMRQMLHGGGVQIPSFALFPVDGDLKAIARQVSYPCVVKPLFLSASRGVIRANDESEFIGAARRLGAILGQPEIAARGGELAKQFLVESFIPGQEVALEGLLIKGELHVLALFDKPDRMDGPFFEETIYITPSRLPTEIQAQIAQCADQSAAALGLREGPIHAELRINDQGPWMIEIAARSIGGLCSRALRFGTGARLEEIILRHALGMKIESLDRERQPAGVMMIPIPGAGVLREIRGLDEARSVPGIEDVTITAHVTQKLVPLPEGASYLGFIFARGADTETVEASLRLAAQRLQFVLEA